MAYLDLKNFDEKEIIPGYRVKFVHTENMTFAYWTISSGSELPLHAHHHEQVANLVEGKFEFNLEGDVRVVEPGEVIVIPGNAKHGGKAVTDCKIIDVFYPVREDYKNK